MVLSFANLDWMHSAFGAAWGGEVLAGWCGGGRSAVTLCSATAGDSQVKQRLEEFGRLSVTASLMDQRCLGHVTA